MGKGGAKDGKEWANDGQRTGRGRAKDGQKMYEGGQRTGAASIFKLNQVIDRDLGYQLHPISLSPSIFRVTGLSHQCGQRESNQ